jgi:hypothetical protein
MPRDLYAVVQVWCVGRDCVDLPSGDGRLSENVGEECFKNSLFFPQGDGRGEAAKVIKR